jgi:cyclopropane fatty-acyl-phospholipid synthase-like methyltransferase
MAAQMGLAATGIDTAARAIEIARDKARRRKLVARSVVCDATALRSLGSVFDTVVDGGLFHVLGDEDRARFVEGPAAVVPGGGRYHLLCFMTASLVTPVPGASPGTRSSPRSAAVGESTRSKRPPSTRPMPRPM